MMNSKNSILKVILIIILFKLFPYLIIGQGQVSHKAFKELLNKDINYILYGDNTPTQAIKIDIGDQEIELKGLFHFGAKKNFKMLLDFKGKIDDGKVTIFTNNKFSSEFSFKPSFFIGIPKMNIYKYATKDKRVFKEKLRFIKLSLIKELETHKKTKIVLQDLIIKGTKLTLSDFQVKGFGYQKKTWNITMASKLPINQVDNTTKIEVAKKFVYYEGIEDVKYYSDIVHKLKDFRDNDNKSIKFDGEAVLSAYENIQKKIDSLESDQMDVEKYSSKKSLKYEVEKSKWSSKRLGWISISPSIGYNQFSTYQNSIFNNEDVEIATWGVNALVHSYYLGEKMVIYGNLGVNISNSNNLSDFTKREYLKRTLIDSLTTTAYYSEEKGVSYQRDSLNLKYGAQFGMTGELYVVPLKKNSFFAPGLFIKGGFNYSEIREKKLQIPLQLGLVFNIKAKSDDVNYFIIKPYFEFEDISTPTNDADNTVINNWFFGFEIGAPINLPNQYK